MVSGLRALEFERKTSGSGEPLRWIEAWQQGDAPTVAMRRDARATGSSTVQRGESEAAEMPLVEMSPFEVR